MKDSFQPTVLIFNEFFGSRKKGSFVAIRGKGVCFRENGGFEIIDDPPEGVQSKVGFLERIAEGKNLEIPEHYAHVMVFLTAHNISFVI
jgi:hypothetical protein